MTRILLLSIRFLDDRYHGQTAHGERAEWPPSPFRLFQALVAGNARGAVLQDAIANGLEWLESLMPPVIVAPQAVEGLERLTYVINNYSHRDAKSRAPKTIRPTLLNGDRLVQYAWSFDADAADAMKNAEAIISAAKRVRCLGWGIDMAIGTGVIVGSMPTMEKTRTTFRLVRLENPQGVDLRTPTVGSLLSLKRTYSGFISRYEVLEVTRMEAAEALYEPVKYLAHSSRPYAAFRLLQPETGKNQTYPATDPVKVAGMVRGAAGKAALDSGRPKDWVDEFVYGHHDGAESFPRFSYLPLPSIQPLIGVGRDQAQEVSHIPPRLPSIQPLIGVGRINRVLIAEPIGAEGNEVAWIKRLLAGHSG